MLPKIRVGWRDGITVVFLVVAAAYFSLSAAGISGPLVAQAYNCGSGAWQDSQQDAWLGAGHGWLGVCMGPPNILNYAGEDHGGANIYQAYMRLRMWQCGKLLYDQQITRWNVPGLYMNTGWWLYMCPNQSDANAQEYTPGQYNWWWYLHY